LNDMIRISNERLPKFAEVLRESQRLEEEERKQSKRKQEDIDKRQRMVRRKSK
jgi:hypothetical protein